MANSLTPSEITSVTAANTPRLIAIAEIVKALIAAYAIPMKGTK